MTDINVDSKLKDAVECLEGFGIRLAAEAKSTATKTLRAKQCEIRSKAIFTVLDGLSTAKAKWAEEFIAEVEKDTNNRKWRELWDDKQEAGYSLQERLSWAMRSVAERRRNG